MLRQELADGIRGTVVSPSGMTTNHLENEAAVREHFGIPDDVGIGATIPIGYPEGRYGPVSRGPLGDVIYRNHWGRS